MLWSGDVFDWRLDSRCAVITLTIFWACRYGDIYPQSIVEEVIGMFIIAIGLVFFGIILGSVAEALQVRFYYETIHYSHNMHHKVSIESNTLVHLIVSDEYFFVVLKSIFCNARAVGLSLNWPNLEWHAHIRTPCIYIRSCVSSQSFELNVWYWNNNNYYIYMSNMKKVFEVYTNAQLTLSTAHHMSTLEVVHCHGIATNIYACCMTQRVSDLNLSQLWLRLRSMYGTMNCNVGCGKIADRWQTDIFSLSDINSQDQEHWCRLLKCSWICTSHVDVLKWKLMFESGVFAETESGCKASSAFQRENGISWQVDESEAASAQAQEQDL